jgi:hypothetical protein
VTLRRNFALCHVTIDNAGEAYHIAKRKELDEK